MVIGSSPSVTAPVHATLGTGAWPRAHGIPALNVRTPEDDYTDPLLYLDPGALRLPTLADLYDVTADNRPVVGMLASSNWHLGMIGHGAAHPGGDRDPVVLLDEDGGTYSNEDIYSLPSIDDPARLESLTQALDGADGRADGAWRGFTLDDDLFVKKGNPARVAYEQHLLERLLSAGRFGADEQPDLLFVNFKATDEAGHRWGPGSWQVGRVIAAQDRALGRLTVFLDRRVGRGRWAVVVTADHGQMPYRRESGAWPIAGGELLRDINARFDGDGDALDVAGRVVSSGVYLHRSEMADNGLAPAAIAGWVSAYTVAQNAQEELRGTWKARGQEVLFDAVMVHDRVVARSCS
jgi:predicted AlkP superfamily pyrophosphatase or phosphodiesterase